MQTRARLVPVVVTALVAALAGVGALVWFAPGPARENAVGEAPCEERGGVRTRSADAAAIEELSDAPEAAAGEATRREEETPVIPSGHALVVVRRAEDRAPIPGATVFWAEESYLSRARRLQGGDESYVDPNELVERVGVSGTTDARGRCLIGPMEITDRIVSDGGRLTIGARHGALWALVETYVTTDRRLITLDLSDADVVRVQVVTAEGKPLPGVVAIFGSESQTQLQSRRARTEGPDAIATIRGPVTFTRFFSEAATMKWGVSVALPMRTRVFAPIDLDALPKEPVVLRVPACASLAVALRGRDHQVVRRKARVHVTAFPRFEPVAPGAPSRSATSLCEQYVDAEDGWLELPFVDVGLTLNFEVDVDRSAAGHAFVDGPDAVGERKEASLDLDYGTVKFVGMILRADGTPVVGERIELHVTGSRGATFPRTGVARFEECETGEGVTDEQGKYALFVPVVGSDAQSFDCELLVRSATGIDRKLAAIAVVPEKNGAAFMGTLHVPED